MFTFNGNIRVSKLLEEHVNQVGGYILSNINDQKLSQDIYDCVLREVIDSKNWNPQARYSNSAPIQGGQIFDLTLSGQLLKTILNQRFNVVGEYEDDTSWIRIGNIEELDKLKSKRAEYGSSGGGIRSQNAPYWRFVIFGHRPPRQNYTFIYGQGFAGKDNGAIVPGKPKMKGTPPTYAFSNGLKVALPQVNKIIESKLEQDILYLNNTWKVGTRLNFKPGYFK